MAARDCRSAHALARRTPPERPAQWEERKRVRRSSPLGALDEIVEFAPQAQKFLPGNLLTANGTSQFDGKGSIQRQETLTTNIAAVVTQVLPNGNMVVEGKQEIRVNFEMRELIVAGIVRPEDIQSDNTIDSTKIAQARISYGGRGQIMDIQQPRYGQQVTDVLLPF